MPPLNSWQIMPVPPPTLPSTTGPPHVCVSEGRSHVVGGQVERVDVVEEPVVGLTHDRQAPCRIRIAFDLGRDEGVADQPDLMRVRDPDRATQQPRLVEPMGTRSSPRSR